MLGTDKSSSPVLTPRPFQAGPKAAPPSGALYGKVAIPEKPVSRSGGQVDDPVLVRLVSPEREPGRVGALPQSLCAADRDREDEEVEVVDEPSRSRARTRVPLPPT